MAATTYLCIPLKRTWEVDFVKPLKAFIATTYSGLGTPGGEANDYSTSLTEFNKLRQTVITKSVDKHESALEVLYRYYDQLLAIEGKFPIAENQIRISFKWQDAFDKESLFSGKRTLTIASGSFERVCVLFNIAALQSQIAESQNLTSDEGLKLAAKLFQQSSGVLAYLKDIVLSSVTSDPTPDLHPDTLNALSALMLAQAQDCFIRKAMNDKMKPAIVAKLAMQGADLYADAMKLLQLETIRSLWPKDWISGVSGKQAAFHSIAECYQSQVSKEAKDFGEEIARLRHGRDLMAAAETRGGVTFSFQDFQKRIVRDLTASEKDNDFIYHSRIPEVAALPPIGKAPVAKCTPMTTPLSGAQFKDLFEKVVPLAVHQAMAIYDQRKAQIVNQEIGRLREATQLLNGVLASLNLPAAIEDLSGTGKVPQSVLDKAATVREMGGIDHLNRLINELPLLLQRNKEILDESDKLLMEEETSDQQLKSQFKERWTRTPSVTLTEPIKAEAGKYRTILSNAINADKIVRERYSVHKSCLELLSKSNADIEASLPSASPVAALQGHPAVTQLRSLLQSVETLKSDRDALENQLKEAPSDMSSKFMTALTQDGAINEEQLSTEQLDRIYGPLRSKVADSVHQQESLLEQIQAKGGQPSANREEKLKEMAAAYDSFIELKGNLEEGTKFYNDLTQLLVKYQNKVSDFCFARKTEKEELMKDLSAGIARQAPSQPPAAPAYQQPTVEGSNTRVPPARPPPPKLPPASATTSAPAASVAPPAPVPAPRTAPQQNQPAYAPGQAPPGGNPGYGAPAPPYPTTVYGGMPYPTYAPMPMGYNPYMNYNVPPQYPPQQQQQYPPQGQPQQYPPQGQPQQYPPQGQQYPPQGYLPGQVPQQQYPPYAPQQQYPGYAGYPPR